MEILTLLASATNVYEIVGELTEYARDINPDIAREAVKAVGRIALSVSNSMYAARHSTAWPRVPRWLRRRSSMPAPAVGIPPVMSQQMHMPHGDSC